MAINSLEIKGKTNYDLDNVVVKNQNLLKSNKQKDY